MHLNRRHLARLTAVVAVAAVTLARVAAAATAPTPLPHPRHVAPPPIANAPPAPPPRRAGREGPICTGPRGPSGPRPEHTLSAYRLAMELGPDFIEPALVSTKAHQLGARHEPDITGTTDVASHPEFAAR